jgi:hypothetical protein
VSVTGISGFTKTVFPPTTDKKSKVLLQEQQLN